MENLEQKIRKDSLISGLLLGVILLVLSIFSFYFITTMASGMMTLVGPLLFSIIIPILLVIFFCIDVRKKIGGYWSFKQATTGIFIMLFAAYIVQTIGRDLIFGKLVEPQMVEKTQAAVMKSTTDMLEKSGASQESIDKKTADIQQQFQSQMNPTVGKIIQGYAITIIFIFVFALIFGAIFKKEIPKYLLTSDDEVGADTTV